MAGWISHVLSYMPCTVRRKFRHLGQPEFHYQVWSSVRSKFEMYELLTSCRQMEKSEKAHIISTVVPTFLTFMGPRIVNVFLSITNKMQRYTILFITVNALHVSGGFSAHHQELKNCTHSIGYMSSLLAATASKLDIHPMLCVQFLSSWWWAEKPPETRTALTVMKNIV